MKKNNKRTLIIIIILAVLAVAGGVYTIVFNTRDKSIGDFPLGTVGNSGGNINNGGMFCEVGGKVYFANSFDNDTLYSMNPDETEIQKVSGAVISNILGAEDYLFFFQRSESGEAGLGSVRVPYSFNRVKTNGKDATSLLRGVVITAQLVDNTIYMQVTTDDGVAFASMKTDGEDYTEIGRYVLDPASAYDGSIYYNETVGSHDLKKFDTRTGGVQTLLSENVWNPVYYNGYIYYMDLGNGYQIRRYNLSGGEIEILCKERVQHFNVGNGFVYYQTMGSDSGLYFMNTDGSGATLLASGEYCKINITSRYVYFKDFFEDGIIYHSYPGSTSYSAFTAANPGLKG
jgi:hypothetical protein